MWTIHNPWFKASNLPSWWQRHYLSSVYCWAIRPNTGPHLSTTIVSLTAGRAVITSTYCYNPEIISPLVHVCMKVFTYLDVLWDVVIFTMEPLLQRRRGIAAVFAFPMKFHFFFIVLLVRSFLCLVSAIVAKLAHNGGRTRRCYSDR